jgi:drug/metabolite transporter (DMT)-like permease
MFIDILGFALLASGITTNKILLASLPVMYFVALRMLVAGSLMVGYHWWFYGFKNENLKKDLVWILLISLATSFINSSLKAFALKHMPSAKAAFLGALDPFITAIYAYFLWNERLSWNKILGICIGFSGALLLLMTTSQSEELYKSIFIFSLPELSMIAAVAISRFGWIQASELLKAKRYTPAELNGMMQLIGGIYALFSALYLGQFVDYSLPTTTQWWALFAYTVIVGNIIALTLYAHILKRYSVTFVSLAGLTIPLFVQLYAPIALGEPISLIFFVSLGITFLGMYVFYRDEVYAMRK